MTPDIRRAALVYAMRSGWSRAERGDLTEAHEIVSEIVEAHAGKVPDDLTQFYGDEFEALDA